MKNQSIWKIDEAEILTSSFSKKLETDILVIGGGLTGVFLSYLLKNCDKKVVLIDKGKIGEGISMKTTGKITYLQGIIYQTLEKTFNKIVSKMYFDSQREGISLLVDSIYKNHIDCDLEKVDSIIFTLEDQNISKIRKERQLLEEFGIKVKDVRSDLVRDGIQVSDTYTFHPLKYIEGLRKCFDKKVECFENTLAQNILCQDGSYLVKTNKGIIYAKNVVVCCHYPFFLIPSFIPLKTYVKREYVSATKLGYSKPYSAISIDQNLHSIRFYKDYLIYASNNQRLTGDLDYQNGYLKNQDSCFHFFKNRPNFSWMNQDIMSHDHLPFIGKIRDHLYLATAYNAWGMTNSIIASKEIFDLLLNNRSKYHSLFDPKRGNSTLYFSSFVGVFHYMKAYFQSMFKKNNPSYVKIDGIFYGIYEDSLKKKHIVKLICPHMKCNLVFNRYEKTWDCPCHGSRFDLDGKLIEGPATFDISKK